ncbi:MAG: LacI family DNA-binding transcriptional regulator [Planctomycetota bacterium]
MPPGRRVTLKDVAKYAGVSVAAVSDIANRNRANLYTSETREKVVAAMNTLGYVAERAAQNLRTGRSGTVGFVLTRRFSNPFFARVADLVDQALATHDLEMQLILVSGRVERAGELARRLIGSGVDGVIAGPLYPWDRTLVGQLGVIESSPLPVVVFGNLEQSAFRNTVLLADMHAGQVAIDYLVGLGHTRIGLFGATPADKAIGKTFSNQDGMERALDRRDLLRHASSWFIPIPDEASGQDHVQEAVRFARRWLATGPDNRPTAIACRNDQCAFALLAALAECGVSVPEELSVLGYDNTAEGEFVFPPLTSVDPRIDICIAEVVQRLLALLASGGLQTDAPSPESEECRSETELATDVPAVVERRSTLPSS